MFGLFGWFPEKGSIKIARLPGLVRGPVNELENLLLIVYIRCCV